MRPFAYICIFVDAFEIFCNHLHQFLYFKKNTFSYFFTHKFVFAYSWIFLHTSLMFFQTYAYFCNLLHICFYFWFFFMLLQYFCILLKSFCNIFVAKFKILKYVVCLIALYYLLLSSWFVCKFSQAFRQKKTSTG